MTRLSGGFKMRALIKVVVWSAALVLCGCARESASAAIQQKPSVSESDTRSCLGAAKKALGLSAEVLKCGHLTGGDALEVVAAVPLKSVKRRGDDVPVSQLAILRERKSGWSAELSVNKQIKNSAGYIGIQFIDESAKELGYYVSFSDHRSDETRGFVIFLSEIAPDGNPEWPVQISWNPVVQRFQQYAGDEEPIGFKSEIKNPPHRNLRNCGGCKQSK